MADPASPEGRWLQGRRVVVTAGGTREPIDPVRYLGNRSSGRMGNALARAAAGAGAEVTLITTAAPPHDIPSLHLVRVETAQSMAEAVRRSLRDATLLVMAAAVADYRPVRVAPQKIKKRAGTWVLQLEPTVDILASLRDAPERAGVFVVGFAAETNDLVENALAKVVQKGLDLIVLNDVSRSDIAMGSEANEVTILDHDGVVAVVPRASKDEVAAAILHVIHGRIA